MSEWEAIPLDPAQRGHPFFTCFAHCREDEWMQLAEAGSDLGGNKGRPLSIHKDEVP